MEAPVYDPKHFESDSLDSAKARILTPEPGVTTEERWARETPYLVEQIAAQLGAGQDSLILDYGCGIGRLAKGLIERTGCAVIGVDISASMRRQAQSYVNSLKFTAVSQPLFLEMLRAGLRVHHGYAVWVLQHCLRPANDIELIRGALQPGARFCVVNTTTRWLPTDQGWKEDGVDVAALLDGCLERVADKALPPEAVSEALGAVSFFRSYRERQPAGAAS